MPPTDKEAGTNGAFAVLWPQIRREPGTKTPNRGANEAETAVVA
ncbi:hypothetical protein SAMN04488239_105279 [Ruegeria marina]|uniref:Uncharacterized protein n=1 Tax=Ruegeria marina TaxID=639004 RepID=A0A1G6SGY6_9RHOB|nr:hypothetical protein SAMN04488239_105279 [Ruegeria marina]